MGNRTRKAQRRSGWRQWTADEAREVLEAWRESGLPLATFARERGLPPLPGFTKRVVLSSSPIRLTG